MYKMANLLYMLLIVFQGWCLQYFLGSFLESRWGCRWNGLYVAAFYAALRMAVKWGMPRGYGNSRAAVGTLAVSLGILIFLALCFYKAFRPIAIFLVVAFQAISDISRYAAAILLGKLGGWMLTILNWCAGKGAFPLDKAFGVMVGGSVAGTLLFQYMAIALLLYFSLHKIVRDYCEKDYSISRTELFFILTPAAVGLMICMLLRIIMITVEDSVPKMLDEKYPVLALVIPAILLLSLLSILYGVKLFQDMICWNREKSSRIVLEKQISSLQEHMKEMERIYSGIRGMRHDMKNTLSIIQRLSAGNSAKEGEELQTYLAELNRSLENLETRFRTGNGVVDTLLNMKYYEAVREIPGLKMDADKLLFPQNLEIRSYDIGVILGNALDNAMEACRKLRAKEPEADVFIRLCSLQKGKLLILKVENSFDGQLTRRRQGEFPKTDKADGKSHGIGLVNIKNTAEKYQGTMDFKAEGRVFILSVLMKNERKEGEKV